MGRPGAQGSPGRPSFPHLKTCEWPRPAAVDGARILPANGAGTEPQNGILRQIRAHARAISTTLPQPLEKQSSFQADLGGPPAGTALANIEINTGVPHGPAGRYKRGRRSAALRAKDCENLLLAAEHAIAIGRPLNRMVTIHFDAAGIANPVKATGQMLKLMGDWLRCYNTVITAVWVREAGPEKGEHVHILLSVPPDKIGSFNRRQRGWLKLIGATWKKGVLLSRPIGGSHQAAFNPLCSCLYKQALSGALDYLLKAANPEARSVHDIHRRQDGGELWGKRCGTTENIGRAARGRSLK